MKFLKKVDPKMASLIGQEAKRQEETLMMIPSENIASYAVEEAVGSSLGNKYAEGYPGRRYYQGQAVVDDVENLVIERAKKLFGVAAANVQAHSGSPANFAVFTAVMKPGDTLMGLSLSSGGHLTHGAARNASSIYFNAVNYQVGKGGLIDYDDLAKQVKNVKPKVIVAGFTAYPRIVDWKRFGEIASSVGAYLLADMSHLAGLVAGGAYPSPAPYVHIIMTTTHKSLRGPRGALILTTHRGLKKDPDLAKKIDSAIIPGIQGGPHLNSIAGIGVALLEATKPSFKKYASQVVANAKALEQEFKKHTLEMVSGGTDSHLLLIDLRSKNILGNTAAEGLEAANIVLNRNGIPHDPNPPFYPSGLRLGTPGITSRGMGTSEMKTIARLLHETLERLSASKKKLGITTEEEKKKANRQKIIEAASLGDIKKQILDLCHRFPIKKVY